MATFSGAKFKQLHTDITRLKLLDVNSAKCRFRVLETPFSGDLTSQNREEYTVIGLIFPNSDIYKERSYKIEIKLSERYPLNPPEVRFLTPIYHPNIAEDGTLCIELLSKTYDWTPDASLIQVIEAVIAIVDNPANGIDYALRHEVAAEYQKNYEQFNRNASEHAKKYGLSR